MQEKDDLCKILATWINWSTVSDSLGHDGWMLLLSVIGIDLRDV